MGIASSRFRFSKRRPERKATASKFLFRSFGDSNSSEEEFEAEERRENGALLVCAPNGTRTRVLALKGLRPRPLDDGGNGEEL